MKHEMITGAVGTSLGVIGTATQTNEILQTISLIITIVGAVISMIVVPILSWYFKAKQDGNITPDEIKEGVEIIKDGTEKLSDTLKDKDKDEPKQ